MKIRFEEKEDIREGFSWNPAKLYICEGKNLATNEEDRLVLWKTGLVSLEMRKGVIMRKTKRGIKDYTMYILGNCEIVADDCKLSLKREKKKNLFEGSLADTTWKINRVSIYDI